MLQHKYKKTGKGLLGVIDKHIHATVAVIISTVVIVVSCYIGNSIEQDNICFADTNIDFTNLQDNEIKMYITNEDIINNIKTANKETKTEKVIYYDIPLSKELQDYTRKICEKYGNLDETLVYALIKQESNFRVKALGDNGKSKGLMQIQEIWHKERMKKLGVDSLMTAKGNIRVGVDILSEKIDKYNDLGKALTAYNAGDGGAYKYYFSKGIYANDYAKKIIKNKDKFKMLED
ncbi:MAG: lytic transglycosylase domain-containing protein [Candidatus Onthovivens sp.]|nr:lytic transglycosylase domain-containing protein [Candidatus Onthovivens sp.]